MSPQHSDKATFHDVAACFSDEEWELLHEWQEELYKNVMKEIRHALILLGPVIATSVFSLRSKEKDNQDSERRCNRNQSPRFPSPKPESLLRMEEESVAELMAHTGAEVEEISTDSDSVLSFRIKEEEETFIIDQQCTGMKDNNSTPTSDPVSVFSQSYDLKENRNYQNTMETERRTKGNRSRERSLGGDTHDDSTQEAAACTSLHRKDKVEVPGKAESGPNSKSQLWPVMDQEQEEEKAMPCESGFGNPDYSNSYQGNCNTERLDALNCEQNLWEANLIASQPSKRKHLRPYACVECDKFFKTKQDLTRHQRTHTGERPYNCTECQKSFSMKHHLTGHQRTHTGERPYQCALCDKSFSRKGNLNHHLRTHVGCNQTSQLLDIIPMRIPAWRN
ncbi:zinc finger protein 282-like isoform X2 [Ambystoma mexicanum]|uniref:zinc finger protein 282-like isoform X2 n=1 Tax=Ambystoma mexicanum TaxID=8296 RepID=UPI0037E813D6